METPSRHLDPPIRLTVLVGALLAVVCVAAYQLNPVFIEYLNYKWMDAIEAGASRPLGDPDVVVVDIDENSLASHGQWPWPRHQIADLLSRIERLGAKSIALNFILAEEDRTSLKAIQQSFSRKYGLTFDNRHLPPELLDNDAILTDLLSDGPFVLGFEFLFDERQNADQRCLLHPLKVVRSWKLPSDGKVSDAFHQAKAVVCNLPQLAQAVSNSGFLNGRPDSDGRLRRLPLVIRYGNALYPNLSLAALLSTAADNTLRWHQRNGGQNLLMLGSTAIPLDANGNVKIHFSTERGAIPRVSAESILEGEAQTGDFKDRIVFVGLSAAGLATTYQTPGNAFLSGMEIHAQLANTLLKHTFIHRPSGMLNTEILLALVLSSLYALCIARVEFTTATVIGSAGIALLWGGAHLLCSSQGLLFSPLLPASAITIDWMFLMLFKYSFRQRTARRQMLAALQLVKNSEQNLNSIIQTIPDIVFRLDPQGRITFISPAVAKYQRQPEEFIGQPLIDMVAPGDRAVVARQIDEQRLYRQIAIDLEVQLLLSSSAKDKSAEKSFFSISTEALLAEQASGDKICIGIQGIARDIDQRKKLEYQLEQSKKMEAIGALAAGVAHDLNNVLSGLVGYPELLLYELPADSPIRNTIEAILKSGQRAAAIVQDMLSIARRNVHIRSITHLNEVIDAYLKMPECLRIIAQPTITIRTALSDDLMNVKGTAVQLSKMIMNLVNNAAEAMPAGGCIRITTQNRYVDTAIQAYEIIPEGEYVCLSILDEGIGIGAEDLHRIFEPFYSKKRLGQSGTGLGMMVVWGTVKDHSGFVDIQSQEGQGTRFDIYLPATRETTMTTAHPRIVLQDYVGRESILVVDDIAEQRDIAVQMLAKLGYHVTSVPGGEHAVAYLENHRTDLIVLDMVMHPGMDGLETYQRILERYPGQKVIIASGYAESDRVKTMQALGAGSYLRKPYTLEKIGLAVRRELDRLKPN